MSRYDRYDVTDEQWEGGLAQVVPLRSRNEWPSRVDHRTVQDEPEAAEQRRMVVLRVQVFADAARSPNTWWPRCRCCST